MITMVQADSAFDQVRLTASRARWHAHVTVANAAVNITNGGADDIDAGDLIMLTKGQQQPSRAGHQRSSNQQIFFETGDSLDLNQSARARSGRCGAAGSRQSAVAARRPLPAAVLVEHVGDAHPADQLLHGRDDRSRRTRVSSAG